MAPIPDQVQNEVCNNASIIKKMLIGINKSLKIQGAPTLVLYKRETTLETIWSCSKRNIG